MTDKKIEQVEKQAMVADFETWLNDIQKNSVQWSRLKDKWLGVK